jgi:ethanolamine ammonia-lyase large subunit
VIELERLFFSLKDAVLISKLDPTEDSVNSIVGITDRMQDILNEIRFNVLES